MNYSRPPFDDVRVRQAMNYAINRDEINKIAAAGLGQPSSAPPPKEHWACDLETQNYYTYDPEKAKKLLADAGHPNGIDVGKLRMVGSTWACSVRKSSSRSSRGSASASSSTAVAPQQASQAYMIEKKGAMLITPSAAYPDLSQLYEQLFGANLGSGTGGEASGGSGSGGESAVGEGPSDLPAPQGPDDLAKPDGTPGDITILNWAGFAAAVT